MPEPTVPRREIAAKQRGPGPVYQLQGVTGYEKHCQTKRRLPAYTFGGRGKLFTDECSPGPGKYGIEKGFTRTGKDGAPQIGVSGRHADLKSFQTPSPDKYDVSPSGEKVYRAAPQYSMSSRNKQSKLDNTPSPNAYSLPTTMGDKLVDKRSNPCYSLTGRSKIGGFSEDLQHTPAPGAYKVTDPSTFKTKAPGYTMVGRNMVPGDTTQKPGPGEHRPEMVSVHKKAAPAFTFGARHSEFLAPLIVECAD